MKTLFNTLFVIGTFLSVHAQKPESECLRKIEVFDSLVRAGNFPDAVAPWMHVRKNCPSLSNKTFESGEAILRYQTEIAAPADKEIVVRDLLKLYDEQNKYFPASASGNSLKKAIALHSINSGNPDEIFQLLDKAFHSDPTVFTDPSALYTYFELYYNKFKSGDKSITTDALFARQDAIESRLATLSPEVGNNRRAARNVSKGIDALLNDITTVENLNTYYEASFENKKTDTLWLGRASSRLMKKNYVSSPIFLKISEASHSVKPTKHSAYNLGTAALRKGNRQLAADYFMESAVLSETVSEKVSTYYMIASTVYGVNDKQKANEFAKMAIKANPKFGKAYMFLAQLYVNSGAECGQTPFERKAIYWLAENMARKAGEVDATLKKNGSDKIADGYSAKAPTAAEIKQEKRSGKEITFNCWINETIKVPKA